MKKLSQNTKIELNTRHPISVDLDTLRDPIYSRYSIDINLQLAKWVGGKKSSQIWVECQTGFDVSTLSDGAKVDRGLNFSALICEFVANIELQALDIGYSFKLVDVVPVIDDAKILVSICRRDNGSLIEVSSSLVGVSELPESDRDLIQSKLKEPLFRDSLEGALYQAVNGSLKCKPEITKNSLIHRFTEENYKLILDDLSGQDDGMWLGRSLALLEIAKNAIPQYKELTKSSDMSIYDFECLLSLDKLHQLWHLFGDEKIGGFLTSLPGFDPVYAAPGLHTQKTIEQFGFLSMQITRTINNLSFENKWVD